MNRKPIRSIYFLLSAFTLFGFTATTASANEALVDQTTKQQKTPSFKAKLIEAPQLTFPTDVDSNSPSYWSGDTFYLFNSNGHPHRSSGTSIENLSNTQPIEWRDAEPVNGGRWMESILRAPNGKLYGFYHIEPKDMCAQYKTSPQIGMARSEDEGATWTNLGIVLEAPAGSDRLKQNPDGTVDCDTPNHYFVGGHGDLSALSDHAQKYVYLYFSSYTSQHEEQGLSIARIAWSDIDQPAGRVWKWHENTWSQPGLKGHLTPILPSTISWHEANSDAFWGASIHWNIYLEHYVILINRAIDSGPQFKQEGTYVMYSKDLSDPTSWTAPEKILDGGSWYPQVVGLELGSGTDSHAGQRARFFNGGRSNHFIEFSK